MKERVQELHDAGKGVRGISLLLGIPTSLVNYYLYPYSCNTKAWARILVLEAGMDHSEVAAVLGIGSNTLNTYLGNRQPRERRRK